MRLSRLLPFILFPHALFAGEETAGEAVVLKNEYLQAFIQPGGTRFEIRDGSGAVIAPAHADSGVRFSAPGETAISEASIEEILRRSGTSLTARLVNREGAEMEARFTADGNTFQVEATGDPNNEYIIEVRTAPIAPVYGLGDHGGYGESANLFGFRDEAFINKGNSHRFVSTFAIFPRQGLGQVVFENGMKRIAIDESENKMGVAKTHRLNAYYFVGDPHAIYRSYMEAREKEGYHDFQPKFRFFELGYEAFGSLGWNTYQTSVESDLKGYLERGYDLQWAVVGSGFWKGERGNAREGSTVAFGMWDTEYEPDRNDRFPNPRYPQIDEFKEFFKENDILLFIGLRINFKAPEVDGSIYEPVNDGPYPVEALEKGYFITNESGEPGIYSVNFPRGPVHLLDGENPEAVEWYLENFEKWGVDGNKEDLMFRSGVALNNDAKVNRINEAFMAKGDYVMVRNAAFSVAGDIIRLEDTKHGFNQDRPVINLLGYSASGYSNGYPDIVAGKYLEVPLSDDEKIYFVRNAMFAAVTPVMSFGLGPWNLDEDQEAIVKKAADLHETLAPYTYSEVVRNAETGYPHAMAPLPVAFPHDAKTYDLANRAKRQWAWMIGTSLLAAPLYGEDYATAQSRDLYLPEGKWMDWETGDVLEGGRVYEDYPFPPEKIPLFVGGDGLIVLRRDEQLYAYYFPLNAGANPYTFTYPDGVSKTTVSVEAGEGDGYTVRNRLGESSPVRYDAERRGYFFPIEPGQDYTILAE